MIEVIISLSLQVQAYGNRPSRLFPKDCANLEKFSRGSPIYRWHHSQTKNSASTRLVLLPLVGNRFACEWGKILLLIYPPFIDLKIWNRIMDSQLQHQSLVTMVNRRLLFLWTIPWVPQPQLQVLRHRFLSYTIKAFPRVTSGRFYLSGHHMNCVRGSA